MLAAARQAGAKVILAGDDRQLASIERGGLFAELRQRHGAAEITEVTRQKVDWQRQAARDLAEGRFAEAVECLRPGRGDHLDREPARCPRCACRGLDARCGGASPGASRFVFAYTNRDVDALNAELRQVHRDRGALTGADVEFDTKHGLAAFAVGDRLQFTDTDKRRHIYNGNAGTITGLDAVDGEITARLDAAGGAGREVTWLAAEFEGFRHGYAGTIYKGQGKTLDRTYLYHTEHWRAAASYVALTRQRDSAQVFVARETARDATQLARQMARGEVRAASVAWATREEAAKVRAERQADPPLPTGRQNAPGRRKRGTRTVAREGARGAGRTAEVECRGGKAGGGPGTGRARGAGAAPGRSCRGLLEGSQGAREARGEDRLRRRCARRWRRGRGRTPRGKPEAVRHRTASAERRPSAAAFWKARRERRGTRGRGQVAGEGRERLAARQP